VARIGSSPRRIVLGFMLATGFITLWISNTAAALMMFPIGMAVLQKFEEQHDPHDPLLRRFGLALMLGIAYAASIGGIGTKIGTGTNFVFVKQASRVMPQEVTFLTWLRVGMPIVLIAIPVVWFYLVRLVARLPVEEFRGGRQAIHEARAKLGRMKRGEVAALIAFLSAAFLWTFRQDIDLGAFRIRGWAGFIPWSWADVLGRPVTTLPKVLADLLGSRGADSVVAMIIGVTLLLVPLQTKPLRFALNTRRVGHIGWDMLVLLGGGFAMAQGIQSSGLSDAIAGTLKGMGHLNPFLVMLVVCLVTTAISEVASNTATASMLLPLLAVSAENLGQPPAPLMFAATLAASFGFMLPAGTPPNAVVYSSGYIPVTQMARSGLAVDLFGAVLIATVCYFVAPWALGLR
jgi:sodium-dependent dicarboxylate transporter 2/3/5